MIDCDNRHLYELYNVYYNARRRWYAGSGAFFDLNANGRRPDGWTSADAAGLAIFPGLVRYDEACNPAVSRNQPRVPRHRARDQRLRLSGLAPRGHHPGALPMGARLRLKASVGGVDPALPRTRDPQRSFARCRSTA